MIIPIVILLLIIIILLDSFNGNYNRETFTTFAPASGSNNYQSAVNIEKTQFKDFGKIGPMPPNPVANNCFLEFGCANYPFSISDKNEGVCRVCTDNSSYAFAREAGTPRQLRQYI